MAKWPLPASGRKNHKTASTITFSRFISNSRPRNDSPCMSSGVPADQPGGSGSSSLDLLLRNIGHQLDICVIILRDLQKGLGKIALKERNGEVYVCSYAGIRTNGELENRVKNLDSELAPLNAAPIHEYSIDKLKSCCSNIEKIAEAYRGFLHNNLWRLNPSGPDNQVVSESIKIRACIRELQGGKIYLHQLGVVLTFYQITHEILAILQRLDGQGPLEFATRIFPVVCDRIINYWLELEAQSTLPEEERQLENVEHAKMRLTIMLRFFKRTNKGEILNGEVEIPTIFHGETDPCSADAIMKQTGGKQLI